MPKRNSDPSSYNLFQHGFRLDSSTHASTVSWALPFGIDLRAADNDAEADVALVLRVHADAIRVVVVGGDALGEEHDRKFTTDEMHRADSYAFETAGWLNLPLRFYECPEVRRDA